MNPNKILEIFDKKLTKLMIPYLLNIF